MFKILQPDEQYDNVHEIDLDKLKEKGIKGIICDIDNTLAPYKQEIILEDSKKWLHKLQSKGFKVCLVSNAMERRVDFFRQQFDLPAIGQAVKPAKRAFKKALHEILQLDNKETAIIGDQVFTDVLGGNRMGLYTILVNPLEKNEFFATKLVRIIEKLIFKREKV